MNRWFSLLLYSVFLLSVFLRFYNLNWDQNQHLHPDERFLTMVTNDIEWPINPAQYLNTAVSPLNPHNRSHSFYVYGTFPVFITKAVAGLVGWDDYGRLVLVGRFLSALLDLGICLLVYLLSLRLTGKKWLSLAAAFIYACIPAAIQYAHFYTTDTWYVFFIVLSFYLTLVLFHPAMAGHPGGVRAWSISLFLGVSMGLIGASKINGLLFLGIIGLMFLWHLLRSKNVMVVGYGLVALVMFFITFRLAQPYLFTGPGFFDLAPNPKLLANWEELSRWSKPENAPPFALQWVPTQPIIYSATHLVFWGLGLPLAILAVISGLLLVHPSTRKPVHSYPFWLSLLWIIVIFIYQSLQFAKPLRYMYPLLPFLAIIVGITLGNAIAYLKRGHSSYWLLAIGCSLTMWWALGFTTIYTHPHTRVQASRWIYDHIPAGKTLTAEIWDDGLPVTLDPIHISQAYPILALPLYDADSPEKWTKLSAQLYQADYVILSSNRLWRSISALPGKYPISAAFYAKLFTGQLGYQTVATFTSYPCLLPRPFNPLTLKPLYTDTRPPAFSLTSTPGCLLALNDDGAEESFTVYDHPKVIILQNTARLSPSTLYSLITR